MLARLCALLSLALILPACGSREDPAAKNAVPAAAVKAPDMDMSKPCLTDKKVQGVIALIKEKPDFLKDFKGAAPAAVSAEMEAAARKYGFANYQDLAVSLHRVTIGMMDVQIAKHNREMSEDEDIPAAAKEMMRDQMKAATGGSELNKDDLKLVEKYFDQLEALADD